MIYSNIINPKFSKNYINEHYGVILRNAELETINEMDMSEIRTSIDQFTEDAHTYLDSLQQKRNEHQKIAEGLALAGLGLYVVGVCVGAAIPVLGILILISSIVVIVLSLIKSTKAHAEYKKIEKFKGDLIRLKSKVKTDKDKVRINEIIERIDYEIDINYKNQPNVNYNHNFNY